jgi:CheY-like chemotaxis protein
MQEKDPISEPLSNAIFSILGVLHSNKDLNSMYKSIQVILSDLLKGQQGSSPAQVEDIRRIWQEIDHDLRSPLFGILGFAELLKEEIQDEETLWKADQILLSAWKMKKVLDQTMQQFAVEEKDNETAENVGELAHRDEPENAPAARRRPKSAGRVKPNVLIVEDNIVNINLLMIYIRRYCNIFSVKNAKAAIDLTQREKIDTILMDINLGQGMDGTQAMHLIRQQPGYEHIPIIAVTAYAGPGFREKFLAEGFNEFIGKPIIREEIKEIMERLFPQT